MEFMQETCQGCGWRIVGGDGVVDVGRAVDG